MSKVAEVECMLEKEKELISCKILINTLQTKLAKFTVKNLEAELARRAKSGAYNHVRIRHNERMEEEYDQFLREVK